MIVKLLNVLSSVKSSNSVDDDSHIANSLGDMEQLEKGSSGTYLIILKGTISSRPTWHGIVVLILDYLSDWK